MNQKSEFFYRQLLGTGHLAAPGKLPGDMTMQPGQGRQKLLGG